MRTYVRILSKLFGGAGGNRSRQPGRNARQTHPRTRATPVVSRDGGSRDSRRGGSGRPQQGVIAEGRGGTRVESDAPVERAAEALPLTVSVDGLAGSADQAGRLEATLRQMRGVIRAYVSPMTALAYVDYLPGIVAEVDLIGAIVGAGYRAGSPERRFAWRRPQ